MNHKLMCPNCEEEHLVEPVSEERIVEIKSEKYPVTVALWRCLNCKEEFEDPDNPIDELNAAYRAYRAAHNMLQPEEARRLREDIGFTQAELAKLLGWSPATISRYENGALQEISHDNVLQSLQEPNYVLSLLERNASMMQPERLKGLRKNTLSHFETKQSQYMIRWLELREPDIYSGYSPFDFNKYRATIHRIITQCSGHGVPKTKLNKLLFYTDFISFARREKSITGSRYTRMPFGPCPEDFQSLLGLLVDSGFVEIDEVPTEKGFQAELIKAPVSLEEEVLSSDEKTIIDEVCKKLGSISMTSTDLKRLSHKEKGYQLTPERDPISYEYANYLQIK